MGDVHPVLRRWQALERWPVGIGPWVFGLALRRAVPYAGTFRPQVRELRPGYARIEMRDRRRVRNHLRSIHAVALMNLGELATGLAMTCGLPASSRAILTALSMDYHKKARGRLTATCTCTPPDAEHDREVEIESEIRDAQGDLVATARARWKVGPQP